MFVCSNRGHPLPPKYLQLTPQFIYKWTDLWSKQLTEFIDLIYVLMALSPIYCHGTKTWSAYYAIEFVWARTMHLNNRRKGVSSMAVVRMLLGWAQLSDFFGSGNSFGIVYLATELPFSCLYSIMLYFDCYVPRQSREEVKLIYWIWSIESHVLTFKASFHSMLNSFFSPR